MSDLVHNERTKLLANALDRASTAFFAVGVLGQVFALVPSETAWLRILSIVIWLLAGIGLHLSARRVLGALRP